MSSKLREIMAGRNGADQLCTAVAALAIGINFLGSLTRRSIFNLISALLLVLAAYRAMSKNIEKRQAENYRFIGIWNEVKNELQRWRLRLSTIREYKFFNCPGCKSRLRVRRGKGKIQITCPRCGLRFNRKL